MKKLISLLVLLSMIAFYNINVYAEDVIDSELVSQTNSFYSSKMLINYEKVEFEQNYSSDIGNENTLIITDNAVTENNLTVTKTGDSESTETDTYGVNAAILSYNSGILNLNGGNITTNGKHANAIFAYGTGTINAIDTKVKTTMDNSAGIMVASGATISTTNLNIETNGNYSAAISSRNGGTIIANGGTYKTTGIASPAVYSMSSISINNANLVATSSESIIIEGANSVSIESTNIDDNNDKLHDNSDTYKNIFIYQSTNDEKTTGIFTAKNSKIITNKGDTFFVTNTNAIINLENNKFIDDEAFLKVQAGKWGTIGNNGGNVTMNLINQKVEGKFIIDENSTLNLNLTKKSKIKGSINNKNTAKEVKLTLDNNSILVLTEDTYITELSNNDKTNSNIYANGHKLFVNNKEVKVNNNKYKDKTNYPMIIIGISTLTICSALVVGIMYKSNKKYFK